MFDKPAAAPAAPAAGTGEKKDGDKKPKAEDTNPILHRIQEAVLQVLNLYGRIFPQRVCVGCCYGYALSGVVEIFQLELPKLDILFKGRGHPRTSKNLSCGFCRRIRLVARLSTGWCSSEPRVWFTYSGMPSRNCVPRRPRSTRSVAEYASETLHPQPVLKKRSF